MKTGKKRIFEEISDESAPPLTYKPYGSSFDETAFPNPLNTFNSNAFSSETYQKSSQ